MKRVVATITVVLLAFIAFITSRHQAVYRPVWQEARAILDENREGEVYAIIARAPTTCCQSIVVRLGEGKATIEIRSAGTIRSGELGETDIAEFGDLMKRARIDVLADSDSYSRPDASEFFLLHTKLGNVRRLYLGYVKYGTIYYDIIEMFYSLKKRVTRPSTALQPRRG